VFGFFVLFLMDVLQCAAVCCVFRKVRVFWSDSWFILNGAFSKCRCMCVGVCVCAKARVFWSDSLLCF